MSLISKNFTRVPLYLVYSPQLLQVFEAFCPCEKQHVAFGFLCDEAWSRHQLLDLNLESSLLATNVILSSEDFVYHHVVSTIVKWLMSFINYKLSQYRHLKPPVIASIKLPMDEK